MSIYALGIPFGSAIGNFVGGWGSEELGWRTTFILVGLPGIAIAMLVLATLREPPRGMSEAKRVDPESLGPAPKMADVLKFLWAKSTFRHMSIACGDRHAERGVEDRKRQTAQQA